MTDTRTCSALRTVNGMPPGGNGSLRRSSSPCKWVGLVDEKTAEAIEGCWYVSVAAGHGIDRAPRGPKPRALKVVADSVLPIRPGVVADTLASP